MSRPISKQQFLDLWWEEFCPDKSMNATGCMICGGSGHLDTRGKVFNAKGEDVGGEALCICPTGRTRRRHHDAVQRRKARETGA